MNRAPGLQLQWDPHSRLGQTPLHLPTERGVHPQIWLGAPPRLALGLGFWCLAWGRIWAQYLQQEPLAAHHSSFAPVDGLGKGQLPAVAQQHRDAGGLWRDPAGWDRAPGPR